MKIIKFLLLLAVCAAFIYGAGRLYFHLTGGFTVANITNNTLSYDPRWKTHSLSFAEQTEIQKALNQDYYYLGKGCQSYVFASADGATVIKFPKYQRFRPQEWINLFTWIPAIKDYQEKKGTFRRQQMEKMFRGWSLGFHPLNKESGVLFVHLNKSPDWTHTLFIHDKLGFVHELNLGQMEFLLQKRATMLEDYIKNQSIEESEIVLDRLLTMVMMEYLSGYADNDHALLQNTGVIDGQPIHIDVGQFVKNSEVKTPQGYNKGLFNKTFRLHEWLSEHFPSLADHLKSRIVAVMGPEYYYFPPYVYRPYYDKLPDDMLISP